MQSPSDDQTLGQFIPLHYHYDMLRDSYRMSSFRDAIGSSISPGMHVVDLGGGTGILSFFAAQQGAKVTYVERNPQLVEVAKKLIRLNYIEDRVTIVQADAKQFIPVEPVDYVVCEMLHVGLLREKQVEVINQFKTNYRSKFNNQLPKFIPEASLLACQGVSQDYHFSGFHAPGPLFQLPAVQHKGTIELTDPVIYQTVWYDKPLKSNLSWQGRLVAKSDGIMNAIRFITKNLLSILISKHCAIEWHNQFMVLPLNSSVEVKQGETLTLEFEYCAGDQLPVLEQSLQLKKLEKELPHKVTASVKKKLAA